MCIACLLDHLFLFHKISPINNSFTSLKNDPFTRVVFKIKSKKVKLYIPISFIALSNNSGLFEI